jgi:hypothetical protein
MPKPANRPAIKIAYNTSKEYDWLMSTIYRIEHNWAGMRSPTTITHPMPSRYPGYIIYESRLLLVEKLLNAVSRKQKVMRGLHIRR